MINMLRINLHLHIKENSDMSLSFHILVALNRYLLRNLVLLGLEQDDMGAV